MSTGSGRYEKSRQPFFFGKIVLIVFLAVLPMVAITLVSVYELKLSTDERQMSLIENNFAQAHHTLEEKMEGVHAISGQFMAICTGDGQVLTSNSVGRPLPDVPLAGMAGGRFALRTVAGEAYYVAARELNDSGLYLLSMLPRSLMNQKVSMVRNRALLSYLAIFLQQDEIDQLIFAYNTMVDELARMLATQYDLGRAKAEAELKALQSQINPHFLYHTLDMVRWMAMKQ